MGKKSAAVSEGVQLSEEERAAAAAAALFEDEEREAAREKPQTKKISKKDKAAKARDTTKRVPLPDRDAPFRRKRFKFLWHVRGCRTTCPIIKLRLRRASLLEDSYAKLGRGLTPPQLRAMTRGHFRARDLRSSRSCLAKSVLIFSFPFFLFFLFG